VKPCLPATSQPPLNLPVLSALILPVSLLLSKCWTVALARSMHSSGGGGRSSWAATDAGRSRLSSGQVVEIIEQLTGLRFLG